MVLAAAAGADPTAVAVVLIELGAIVVGLALLARGAHRVGFSPIPFYLLAGLAFGEGGLLPLDLTEGFVGLVAEIGVLLLLFMLGLEYTADELRTSLAQGWPSGVFDAVLNITPGFATGLLLGWDPVAALLLGGVTWISSSGVIAKLLRDLGRLGNRETPAVLSILVMEDLAMAAYLPLMAVLVAATGFASAVASLTVAVVTVMLVLLVALRWGDAVSRALSSPSDEVILLTTFGVVLLVAGLAQALQVSAAIGAFLVGISLSGGVAERARTLLGPLRDLFAAVFFVFFGLQVDPGEIPAVAGVAIALGLVSSATKIGTGWWTARRAGIGNRGRWRAGATLVARGEFSIVIAALGAGINPQLGPLTAAYVLFLAILGPVLARISDPVVAAVTARRDRLAAARAG